MYVFDNIDVHWAQRYEWFTRQTTTASTADGAKMGGKGFNCVLGQTAVDINR